MDIPRFPKTTERCERCGTLTTIVPVLMGNHGVNPSVGHILEHAAFLCEPCALSDLPDDGEEWDYPHIVPSVWA